MKALFIVLAASFVATCAGASFIDCRPTNWFQFSVDFVADETSSKYIKSNEQERYTSISNTDSDPIYVVANGQEIFKLADSKVYEPRTILGKSLGWKKIRFTYQSDTLESDPTADLFHLILSQENLPKFGASESLMNEFKVKLTKCGPNRPASIDAGLPAQLEFYLKIKGKMHKIEGKAFIHLNDKYDPKLTCCKQ